MIAIRVSDSLVEKIDLEVKRRREAEPGQQVTRSDVVRQALMVALAAAERQSPKTSEA